MSDFVSKNKLFLASVAAGAAGFGVYYYLAHIRQETFSDPYPKDVVIATLKDFRREFNRLNVGLFQQISKVKQMMRANGRQLDPAALEGFRVMLVDENPEFQEGIEEIETRVYEKHGITDKVRFQKSCEVAYKLDPEVSSLMKGMYNAMESVLHGNPPVNDIVLPREMTPELTLKVVTRSADAYLKNFLDIVEQFLVRGQKVSKENIEFLNSIRFMPEDAKTNVMKELGVDTMSDDPEAMFSKAVSTYIQADPDNFRQKMHDVESKNKTIMSAVLNGAVSLDMVKKFKEQLLNPAGAVIPEENPQSEVDAEGETAQQPTDVAQAETEQPVEHQEQPQEETAVVAESAPVEVEQAAETPAVEGETVNHEVVVKQDESVVLSAPLAQPSTNEETLTHSDAQQH